MSDTIALLSSLRDEPLPDALASMDDGIMARLGKSRERIAARRGLALACAVAAGVGLWGGLASPPWLKSGGHSPAFSQDEPVLGMPAAAPSHLLAS